MSMENYVPAMQRVTEFRNDFKDKEVLINTIVSLDLEKEAAMFKAEIIVDGKVVAVGHSLAPSLGDDKEFEKAETAAVGRALAFLGYEAELDDGESEKSSKKTESRSSRGGLGGGLGNKKASKKEEVEDDAEEDSEEEKPKSSKSQVKKEELKEDDSEEDSEDEDTEEESDEEESEEEEEAPKKSAPAGVSKLSGVMQKYGLKK